MPELQQLLEDAIERLPAPVTPSFDAIVARAQRRRTRRFIAAGAAAAVVVIAAALAVPQAFNSDHGSARIIPAQLPSPSPIPSPSPSALPGSDAITALAAPVAANRSGTSEVELGAPPSGANAIQLQFTCLSNGTFSFADGSGSVTLARRQAQRQLRSWRPSSRCNRVSIRQPSGRRPV